MNLRARRRSGRAYVAIIFVASLAAILLGASTVLSGALWRGQRSGASRDRATASRLAVERALVRAVAECRIAGTAWTPASAAPGVTELTAERTGTGFRITARATDPAAPHVRRIDVSVLDHRAAGDRVVAVR